MKIAITGHRPNKLGNDYELKSSLILQIKQEIIDFILFIKWPQNIPDCEFITGMALGIDQLFAEIAIENEFPFIAAIPFKGQDRMWPISSQLRYHELLKKASKIVVCDTGSVYTNYMDFMTKEPIGSFSNDKMQKRNIWMVDNCELLIGVWDGTNGGTKNCLDYAKKKSRLIIIINPNDYRL